MKKILVLVMVLMMVGCDESIKREYPKIGGGFTGDHETLYDELQVIKEQNNLILDRLDTIDARFDSLEYDTNWWNSDLLKELARIESELGIYPIYVEEDDTMDNYKLCVIDLLDDIFDDFSSGTIDDVYWWEYDWRTQTITYKSNEDSEERTITITEILEDECG